MRFIRFLFFFAIFIGCIVGLLWSKRDTIASRLAIKTVHDKTGLPLSIGTAHIDWGNRVLLFSDVRLGDAPNDAAHAESIEIGFDLSRIRERKLDVPLVKVHGLSLENEGADGVLFRFLKSFKHTPDDPSDLKVSVGDLQFEQPLAARFHFGEAQIDLHPDRLLLNLRDPDPSIDADGAAQIHLQLPPILKSLEELNGALKISGKLKAPAIDLTVSQSAPGAVAISLQSSLKNGVLVMLPHVDGTATAVRGAIEVVPAGSLLRVQDLALEHFPLKGLSEDAPAADVSLFANGQFSFVRLDGELAGRMSVENITLPGLERGETEFSLSGRSLSFKNAILAGPSGEIRGEGSATPGLEEIDAAISSSGFTLREAQDPQLTKSWVTAGGAVQIKGSTRELTLSGMIAATYSRLRFGEGKKANLFTLPIKLSLSGNPRNLRSIHGEIELPPVSMPQFNMDVTVAKPTVLKIADSILTVPPLEILAGGQKLNLSGTLSQLGYDLSLHGGAEIGALYSEIPGVDDLRGQADLALKVSGPLSAPDIDGDITVSDGAIAVPIGEENATVTGISGKILFRNSDLTVGPLKSSGGDAGLLIEGSVHDVITAARRSGEIDIHLKDLSALPVSGLTARGRTDLAVKFLPGNPRPLIEGEVLLQEVLYEQKTDLNTLLKQVIQFFRNKKVPVTANRTAQSQELPFDLAIEISGSRTIVFDTDFLQTELSSELSLHSVEKEPRLSGNISGDSGDLDLGKAQLSISKIALHFDDTPLGSSPSIELRAEGELGERGAEEFVQLEITGNLPAPEIRLRSETGRSEKELLALMGLGFDKLSVIRKSDDRLTVGQLINPFSRASLSDRLTSITGVSNVEIESGYSADTGEFAPRLRIERPLPAKFSLVGRSEFTQFSRSEINIEYPLTEQTKVFAGWQNAPTTRNPDSLSGSYGYGIHYRERFGGTSLFPGELILENLRGLVP